MEYPLQAPITWRMTSAKSLEALDQKEEQLTQVPDSEVQNVLNGGNAEKFTVELVHNTAARAGECCLYQKVGGIWMCVKRC